LMESYVLPKGSGKKVGKDYGFKGYGFTFATFVSEEVTIKSRFLNNERTYALYLEGCFNWLAKNAEFPRGPGQEPSDVDAPLTEASGTSIKIKLSNNYA